MGGGRWDDHVYASYTSDRKSKGIADFAYSHATASMDADDRKAHALLDPMGLKMRESRDSDEHPTSRAVIVALDVTGSMSTIPGIVQQKLPKLMGLITAKGGLEHPHLMTMAIGDSPCGDTVPLQVGQFESDIRIDEQIRSLFLEGGGGGTLEESYNLALYVAARKTSIDCWEKRREKGYMFLMGDEKAYRTTTAKELKKIFGDGVDGQVTDVDIETLVAETLEKYEVFFIWPTAGASNSHSKSIRNFWSGLFGQRVLDLEDPTLVTELIATTIATNEGVEIDDLGLDAHAKGVVGKALAHYTGGSAVAKKAKVDGTLAPVEGGGGSTRL